MKRHPDEIMTAFINAQQELDAMNPGKYDLEDLVWDVIDDILDSVKLAEDTHVRTYPRQQHAHIHSTVSDYAGNHYDF